MQREMEPNNVRKRMQLLAATFRKRPLLYVAFVVVCTVAVSGLAFFELIPKNIPCSIDQKQTNVERADIAADSSGALRQPCHFLGNNVHLCNWSPTGDNLSTVVDKSSGFQLYVNGVECFVYQGRDMVLILYEQFQRCVYGNAKAQVFPACSLRIQIDSHDQYHLRYLFSSPKYKHVFIYEVDGYDLIVQRLLTIVGMRCTLTLNQTNAMFSYMLDKVYSENVIKLM